MRFARGAGRDQTARMLLAPCAAALALAAALLAPPARPPAAKPFAGTLAEALAAAAERNVPVLVHVLLPDEESSGEYRKRVLPDAELAKASREAVVLLVDPGEHARKQVEREVEGQGVRIEACALYGDLGVGPCGEHRSAWAEVHERFRRDDGLLHGPQTIVLAPDGAPLARIDRHAAPAVSEVLAGLALARAKLGPGLDEARLGEVRALGEAARAHAATRAFGEAWRTWGRSLAVAGRTRYADEAREGQAAALRGIEQELARIAARLVPGTAGEAWAELAALARSAAGTPLEKDLAARLAKAEKDAGLRAEIAAHKLELEGETLFAEAAALEAAGDARKAEAAVRKLVARRLAGTRAASRARERWPAWTAPRAGG